MAQSAEEHVKRGGTKSFTARPRISSSAHAATR